MWAKYRPFRNGALDAMQVMRSPEQLSDLGETQPKESLPSRRSTLCVGGFACSPSHFPKKQRLPLALEACFRCETFRGAGYFRVQASSTKTDKRESHLRQMNEHVRRHEKKHTRVKRLTELPVRFSKAGTRRDWTGFWFCLALDVRRVHIAGGSNIANRCFLFFFPFFPVFSLEKGVEQHHVSHNQNPVLKWSTQNHVKN